MKKRNSSIHPLVVVLFKLCRSSGLITALMFLICLAAVESASAAVYTVTNTNDSGAGSLREAVITANSTAEDDTIEFAIPASDLNCTAEGVCTITLTSGELFVQSASTAGTLTITNSTGASNLRISGNNTSRVFYVNTGNPGGNLTINGVTITNGTAGLGGGIFNIGTITLTNSTVSGNTANNNGGGIFNNFGGTVTLTNSTVSGNTANYGGGIINDGTMTLTNSTVSGNTATFDGGGILNARTMTLTNSTVSGNTANFRGGGIINGSILNLTSVTVTNNRSINPGCTGCAGGIDNFGATNLNNTIVAGNTAADASASPDFRGVVSSTSSYNIIGNGQSTTGITNGTNGNQVGAPASPIDARLAPLANNGGATQTHALLPDSPAIDKGSRFDLTTDQRGFARPVDLPDTTYPNATGGDGSDIGAFEYAPAPKSRKRVKFLLKL